MTLVDGGDGATDEGEFAAGPQDRKGVGRLPSRPVRIESFVRFFKTYMSLSTLVVAAAPIPIGSLHLIPTYASQRGLIMTLSSLLSFLLLGYVFFNRVWFAKGWFPESGGFSQKLVSALPAACIVGCVASMIGYLFVLGHVDATQLDHATPQQIAFPIFLVFLQVGFFVFAELAFIIMALREYLQDLLEQSDEKLIRAPTMDRSFFGEDEYAEPRLAALLVGSERARVVESGKTDTFVTLARSGITIMVPSHEFRHEMMTVEVSALDEPKTGLSMGVPDASPDAAVEDEEEAEMIAEVAESMVIAERVGAAAPDQSR
jgi:hypothetical protein